MDLIGFAQQNKVLFTTLHLFGVFVSFGTVMIADVFFLKLLKNLNATKIEINILRAFSKIIWFGLLVIVSAGIFLFLSDIDKYSQSAKFLTKMLVVFVIIINGLFLHFISPKLSSIPFRELMTSSDENIKEVRRLFFAFGSISSLSWWSAFILGIMKTSPAPFQILLTIYLVVLFTGMLISQVFERIISRRKISN
ncbi:MAG: hypothetical protein ACD_50C00336G0003 [uncultured bacterium]|nr:MAG: hypothetical protein ACD_50C00336G0003 [uncultured bacterium]